MIRSLAAAAFALVLAASAPAFAGAPLQDDDQSRALALLVQAREAPAVQETESHLEAALRATMQRLDGDFARREARARDLSAEVAEAREAGDNAKLNLLAGEADQLRSYFAPLRERALADPAVIAARQRMEEAMMTRMTELGPAAPALIARVRASMGN